MTDYRALTFDEIDTTEKENNCHLLPEYSDEYLASNFRLRRDAGPDFRYVASWGHWKFFTGTRWAQDRTLRAQNRMRALCAENARQIAEDEKIPPAVRARLSATVASAQKVYASLRLAANDRDLSLDCDVWDSNPWLLNTPAGTLDLRTSKLHSHCREDYITKVTAVGPSGDCPLWRRLIIEWMDGDEEKAAFLQRYFGYSLTGTISEHAMIFCHGLGANGKSTVINAITELLGDYCQVASMETFIETQGERHPADLAMLHGARLVVAQETEEGRRWATSRIKSLTSGDPITARFMRQDFFTFRPSFKLLFAGNHRPALRHVDEAMRRRIHMVPFTVTIAPDQRDASLPGKLRDELPGILVWALEGCQEWQRIGLAPPESVREATADYLSDEDVFAAWIEEAVENDPLAFVRVADLHGAYQAWAKKSGERFFGLKRFSQTLEDRGFERGKHPVDRTRGFRGIRLRVDAGGAGTML